MLVHSCDFRENISMFIAVGGAGRDILSGALKSECALIYCTSDFKLNLPLRFYLKVHLEVTICSAVFVSATLLVLLVFRVKRPVVNLLTVINHM